MAETARRMRLLFAAGGTGGHLYPAIAVARRVRELAEGAEVIFVGTERGLESSIVPAAGFPLELVRAAPLRGGSLGRKLRGVQGLFLGLVDSVRLLKRLDPQAVMGVGAYVSGTVLLAASLKGDSDAHPGAERGAGPRESLARALRRRSRLRLGGNDAVLRKEGIRLRKPGSARDCCRFPRSAHRARSGCGSSSSGGARDRRP